VSINHTQPDNIDIKKGLSLVELMIVVAVLGILAAIVVPQLQSHTTQAKEAAAKSDLRVLRSAIELYTVQHNGVPPGYPDGDVTAAPTAITFVAQLTEASQKTGQTAAPGTAGYKLGPYIRKFPQNPFNNATTVKILGNSEEFPANATGNFAYLYQPATKTIKLDWPGNDSSGISYFDY
jgi:prepilin-type N-terminal cleavage/methylation domain-containing protein